MIDFEDCSRRDFDLAARIAQRRGNLRKSNKGLLGRLGPGLITGASDDDPSGIATYSQIGAQFGYAMCWVMLFCFPLMAAIQEISARIGRVTGQGIAGNIRAHYPPHVALRRSSALLLLANIINLGADLGRDGRRAGAADWRPGQSLRRRFRGRLRLARGVFAVPALCLHPEMGQLRLARVCRRLHSWCTCPGVLSSTAPSCRVSRCRGTTSSPWSRCWGRRSRPIVSSGNPRRRRKTSA